MKRTRHRLGVAGAVLAFLWWTAAPSGSLSPAPAESGTFRLLRTIRFDSPVVSCSGDQGSDCVEISTTPEVFDLRAATSTLDVTMTLTITYRTTAHDPAVVYATLRPKVAGRLMKPGRLPLRASTTGTTTTLRWTAEDVPPDLYRLGFQIEYGKSATLPLRIRAPKVTLLIEAWEGGA